jgi:hypothetical protein
MERDCNAVTVNVRDRLTAISWSVMSIAVPSRFEMRTK